MKDAATNETLSKSGDLTDEPAMPAITNGRNVFLHRAVVALAILLPVVYGFMINRDSLDSPPAWDSATTVSPAALTIVDRDFDIWEVAQLPSSLEGGPSIHATSIYTIALAGLIWLVGPTSAFYLAHISSILLVGALAAATYLLARLRASVYVSGLCALTVAIVPLIVQQASDVYVDLPLAVVATFAAWAATRRNFLLTTLLVVVGVAIKTSGVFLIPLLQLAKPEERDRSRHLMLALGAIALALVPFMAAFVNTDRFDGQGGLVSGGLRLIGSSAAMLFETLDVFIILSIYLLVTYSRVRSRTLDRPSLVAAIMVASFFVVYGGTMILSQTIAVLPRYYIVILPALLVSLLPPGVKDRTGPRTRILGISLVGALAMFSLINVRGDFYPLPNNEFYVLAERSTRGQDLLELQIAGTRKLVATGQPLVVDGPTHFRLAYPDLGYVEEEPTNLVITTYEPPRELPDRFAMLIERRFGNALIGIEERAIEEGFTLDYEEIASGGFSSELVTASR